MEKDASISRECKMSSLTDAGLAQSASESSYLHQSSEKKHRTSHAMASCDPENPQNWPNLQKFHASLAGFSFTFVLSVWHLIEMFNANTNAVFLVRLAWPRGLLGFKKIWRCQWKKQLQLFPFTSSVSFLLPSFHLTCQRSWGDQINTFCAWHATRLSSSEQHIPLPIHP